MKLRKWEFGVGENHQVRWIFRCPGCKMDHCYITEASKEPRWQFNGDLDRPTFTPSLLYNANRGNPTVPLCHLYVTNGQIQFLSDCTHELAGKTVPMSEVE